MVDDDSRPTPDPTTLTTAQLVRAVEAERDYVNGQLDVLRERLRAIDVATRLLNETVNRVPTDVQKEVRHLRELSDEKLVSVATQFRERDTRQERESRDNKVAVDAAFAAQKEAAAAQDKANREAIDKSERATAETIKTNQELSKATTDALTKGLDEVKLQVSRIESVKTGGREALSGIYALTAFLAAVVVIGAALAAAGVFSR